MSEQTATDWRALPAGRKLDWIVAERLGYKIKEYRYSGNKRGYELYDGKGKYVAPPYDNRAGDMPTKSDLRSWIPQYSRNANAALALLPLVGGEWTWWTLQPTRIDLTYRCEIHEGVREWQGEADTPAHAIVKAWLAWKDTQHE